MSVSETAFIADIVDEFRAYRRSTDARIAALERAVREARAQLSASSHAHQAQKEDVDEEGEGGLISAYGRRGGGLELELLGDNQDLIKGKGVIAATRVALGDASSSSSQARASSSSTGPPIPHVRRNFSEVVSQIYGTEPSLSADAPIQASRQCHRYPSSRHPPTLREARPRERLSRVRCVPPARGFTSVQVNDEPNREGDQGALSDEGELVERVVDLRRFQY